jgi:predicted Zn-dependent peptidase
LIRRKSEQAHLAVGYRAFKRNDPDREALDVATQVLGGGPSSRLFEEIREQRGLAYSVYSGVAAYADAGALSVYAGTSPSHVDEVMGLIDGELRKLAADGITEHELDVAKGYLTGSFVLGLEDSASRMSRLAHHVTMRGAVRPVADQLARYDAVTLEDVTRAVRRVLENQRVVAAVGPVKKAQLTA